MTTAYELSNRALTATKLLGDTELVIVAEGPVAAAYDAYHGRNEAESLEEECRTRADDYETAQYEHDDAAEAVLDSVPEGCELNEEHNTAIAAHRAARDACREASAMWRTMANEEEK